MRKFLLTAALSAVCFSVFAQTDTTGDGNSDEYELRGNEKYGYIVTQDDKKIEGIVKLLGTPQTPWVNQKKVKFIAKADINPNKKRQKFEKLSTDDLQEYVAYEDDGTERHFQLIKYSNVRQGLGGGSGIGSQVKSIKNLSTTRHMAEVIIEGSRVTVYRLYGYPSPVAVGSSDYQQYQQDVVEIIDYPTILYKKDDERVKELHSGNIKDIVDDCTAVREKMKGGQYSSYNPDKQEKERSGMGKLMKNEADHGDSNLTKMAVEIFTDYNALCGK